MFLWLAWLSRSLQRYTVGLFLVFLLVGCGLASLPPASSLVLSEIRSVSTGASRTYLGVVNGTQADLGVVLSGTRIRAYVCDGTPNRLARLSEWFDTHMASGKAKVSSQDQQVQLIAQFTDQSVTGTLRLASGRVYLFSISQVPATAQVGVFEGTAFIGGQRYHAGWLLLPGGEQRGAAISYPSSPIRGHIMIALLPAFSSSSLQ